MRFLFIAAGLLLLPIAAAQAKPSSFQRSCDDIRIEVTSSGAYLSAQCRDGQGQYRATDMRLIGYQNDDGYLIRYGFENSSFQHSCDQYWLEVTDGWGALHGNCRSRDGSYVESEIELQGIENIGGQLIGF